MKLLLWLTALTLGLGLGPRCGAGETFRAKLNVERQRDMRLVRYGTMYLPATQTQKSDAIVFEAEQVHDLEYVFPRIRMVKTADGHALEHVRGMAFHFEVTRPGRYRAWYRATFPTNLGYLHGENMDGGETRSVRDSERLTPNVWRWHAGPVYELSKGRHVWNFPSPGAWCGGTRLDKLALIPEDSAVPPEKFAPSGTAVAIPESGEIALRRIKAKQLQKWRLGFDLDLNGGTFTPEFRYDAAPFRPVRAGEWEEVPSDANYLFFRFRLKRDAKQLLSPFVHNLELEVLEKE